MDQFDDIAALSSLLARLYTPSELRLLVLDIRDGRNLAASLPEAGSLTELANAVTEGLVRHGLLNGEFFEHMHQTRPRHEREIASIAARFSRRAQILMVPRINARMRALGGTWRGLLSQYLENDAHETKVVAELTLKFVGPNCEGRVNIGRPPPRHHEPFQSFRVIGLELVGAGTLILDYMSDDESVIRFGRWFASIPNEARQLSGCFAGVGGMSGGIICGRVTLTLCPEAGNPCVTDDV